MPAILSLDYRTIAEQLKVWGISPEPPYVTACSAGFSGSAVFRIQTSQAPWRLKLWPATADSRYRLGWIREILDLAAHREYSLLPRWWSPPGSAKYELLQSRDHYWEVLSWLPGQADFHARPSLHKLRQATDQVAALHDLIAAIDPPDSSTALAQDKSSRILAQRWELLRASPLPKLALISRQIPVETLVLEPTLLESGGRLEQWRANLLHEGRDWLSDRFPTQTIIRDTWHDHLLYSQETLTGIIDLESVSRDWVGCVWARLLGSLRFEGTIPWQRFRTDLLPGALPTDREWSACWWLLRANLCLSCLNWWQWLSATPEAATTDARGWRRLGFLQEQLRLAIRINQN